MVASKRSQKVEDAIIKGVSEGITLSELCRTHDMARRTFYDWMDGDPELSARFARARELGFDAIAEECLAIAEDGTNDWMERRTADGTIQPSINGEHVQRSKLRVETRLKLLAKWSPKKYGDRTMIGSDPENPLPSGIEVKFIGNK